ncbi:PAS domain S-box protein [Azospirillum sp. A1-3]|uniref:sensor histidine kinase n=1 Tax=Azospirillum sp. A1-3 TaxID=185874 RepID=UPI00207743AF|nr:PAS domain S-box protein [Azospirillum sp. A1-3]MCM8732957.1 PAS domain S-box protein [Azospirillum sp. A1-3]
MAVGALFRDCREVVALLSADGCVLRISDAVMDLLGHPSDMLTGTSFDGHIHPDDVEEARHRFQLRAAAPAGSSGRAVFRFRHADGGWRWLEVTTRNELADPAIGGLVLTVRDISHHIALSERLRASEARYRTLAEAVPVGILQADADGQVLFANARLAGITGLEPDRLLGGGWLDAVHPDDRARVAADWRLDATGDPAPTDFRFHDSDGAGVDRRVLCQRMALEDGGTIATITDVSEYVHTANALRLSEARNEAILDTAAEAILTIDEAGVLHSFNRAAEAMFGVAAGDLLWRPLDRLIPLTDLREEGGVRLKFAPGQTTALIARDRAAEAERADGTRFPVELSVSASEVEGRRLYTAILRDVTERRRTEAELLAAKDAAEAADRAKSTFIAAMSHELRTPLNAVIGFSQLLEAQSGRSVGDAERNDQMRDCVGAIRQAGEQLLAIIDDILDMARVDAGGLSLTEAPVDLSAVVDRAVADLHFHATRQSVTVEVVADGGLPSIRGDQRRLIQALGNLLSNAIKFSHPWDTVTLTAALAADGWVELSVRDRGVGMRPEDIAKALTPFAQLDQGPTRRHEGVGLGLPLASRLVEAHGGTLTLDSALGQGCTATIRLPPSRIMTVAEVLAAMS